MVRPFRVNPIYLIEVEQVHELGMKATGQSGFGAIASANLFGISQP